MTFPTAGKVGTASAYDSKVLYGGCQKVVPMFNYFFGKHLFQLRRPIEYKCMANKTG